jgi:hypothetical protein
MHCTAALLALSAALPAAAIIIMLPIQATAATPSAPQQLQWTGLQTRVMQSQCSKMQHSHGCNGQRSCISSDSHAAAAAMM